MKEILILIPMYNEEKRIDLKSFEEILPVADLLFIDDGSQDNTFNLVKNFYETNSQVQCLRSDTNLGKGPVLRYAVKNQIELINKYKYIAYWDADLSTPLNEILPMIRFLKDNQDYDSVWGSRKKVNENQIKRRFYRHIFGRIFNFITYLLFKHPFHDTQCGSKVFTNKVIEVSFNEPFLSRWIFDLEIFLRLKKNNVRIYEMSLREWVHKKDSKISLIKDGPSIIFDIIRCFKHY